MHWKRKISVHLYINILFNMLYLCIQQTQTVQCRQTLCIYVCKISRTYQQSMIHIAYDMQFLYATLFPCNRWINCQLKPLKPTYRQWKPSLTTEKKPKEIHRKISCSAIAPHYDSTTHTRTTQMERNKHRHLNEDKTNILTDAHLPVTYKNKSNLH